VNAELLLNYHSRFQGDNFYKNLELVEKVKTLAVGKGCSPSQLAIAWVLAQGEDIITIPGTKQIKHLEQNMAAENVQLTKADLHSIEAILPAGIVAGTRYPEKFMGHMGRSVRGYHSPQNVEFWPN
jgi:aryl-alcohol dehydrogenase-like predicted oxidoreductase